MLLVITLIVERGVVATEDVLVMTTVEGSETTIVAIEAGAGSEAASELTGVSDSSVVALVTVSVISVVEVLSEDSMVTSVVSLVVSAALEDSAVTVEVMTLVVSEVLADSTVSVVVDSVVSPDNGQ